MMNYSVIKLLIIDVDGTLTDGSVFYGDNNMDIKAFDVKDGLVLKPLGKLGISVIFLTGRESEAVKRRAAELGATAVQNVSDKAAKLYDLLEKRGVHPNQIAYIGDDINDYTAMKLCGFKACPADAVEEIRELCDYVSPYNGGHGAVRDICEVLLKEAGIWTELLKFYGV